MADLRKTTPPPLSALVLGATGGVGQVLLQEVLKSNHFTRVGEYGRRIHPEEHIPDGTSDKLEQKIIDFEKLDETGLKDGKWDVIFVTLGSSILDVGEEEFERVDREYVLNAARAARSEDPTHKQRFVYVSSAMANPTSGKLYLKSKGLTEQGLAEVGYDDLIVFRPSFLTGISRQRRRLGELALRPLLSIASMFSANTTIPASTLAQAMRFAGELGSDGLRADDKTTESWDGPPFTVIHNAAAKRVVQRVYT